MERRSKPGIGGPLIVVVLGILAICVFFAFIGAMSSLNRPDPGEVNLIRNAGWFDDRSIDEIRGPGASYSIPGFWQETRTYLAGDQQRFYTVASDPSLEDKSATSFIEVPTRDGVEVAIDAQILFRTAFTDKDGNLTPESEKLLEDFDEAFGNREWTSRDGDEGRVWEGTEGWNAFLDAIFRPRVENAFRKEIGAVNCAELVSSCALVQSTGSPVNVAALQEQAKEGKTPDNKSSFTAIQTSVQEQLTESVVSALGDEYLTDFSVEVTKVKLPSKIQDAINRAQASFADIAKGRAENEKAKFEAERNERLAQAYERSPVLGQIEMARILAESNATIILDGTGGLGLNVGK